MGLLFHRFCEFSLASTQQGDRNNKRENDKCENNATDDDENGRVDARFAIVKVVESRPRTATKIIFSTNNIQKNVQNFTKAFLLTHSNRAPHHRQQHIGLWFRFETNHLPVRPWVVNNVGCILQVGRCNREAPENTTSRLTRHHMTHKCSCPLKHTCLLYLLLTECYLKNF